MAAVEEEGPFKAYKEARVGNGRGECGAQERMPARHVSVQRAHLK